MTIIAEEDKDVAEPESVLGGRGHDALGCLGGEILQLPHLGGHGYRL